MLRTMMKSKIHRATVTQADLHYVGSVTVDEDLLDAADLLAGELVHIVDVTNGARLETYTIAGERGSGVIGINGAAARLVHPGDTVILIGYGQMDTAEAKAARAARRLRRRRQQDHGHRLRPRRHLRRRDLVPRRPRRSIACADDLPPAGPGPSPCPGARLDHPRRRRRGGLRHRRAHRRAAHPRREPVAAPARRHQGRPRRRVDAVGPGRDRRSARAGRHPRAARARHARRGGRCLRRGGRTRPGDRRPRGGARADRPRHAVRPPPRRRAVADPRGRPPPRPHRPRRRRRHGRGDPARADRRGRAGAGDRGRPARAGRRPAPRRRRRRGRPDAARPRRGPARRGGCRALPGGRPRLGWPRPGLQPVHQPQRVHRGRDGRRDAGRAPGSATSSSSSSTPPSCGSAPTPRASSR